MTEVLSQQHRHAHACPTKKNSFLDWHSIQSDIHPSLYSPLDCGLKNYIKSSLMWVIFVSYLIHAWTFLSLIPIEWTPGWVTTELLPNRSVAQVIIADIYISELFVRNWRLWILLQVLEMQQRKCSVIFELSCNLARVLEFCTCEIPQAFLLGPGMNLQRLTELIIFMLNHVLVAGDSEFFDL